MTANLVHVTTEQEMSAYATTTYFHLVDSSHNARRSRSPEFSAKVFAFSGPITPYGCQERQQVVHPLRSSRFQ